jgi:TolB-like protein
MTTGATMRRLVAVGVVLLMAGPARGEEITAAARRVAGSLVEALARRGAQAPGVVAVSPARETSSAQASGAGRAFTEALAAELARTGKVKVREWDLLDKTQRERTLTALVGGGLALPPLPEVQAVVVTEASGGGDGPVRVQVRLVAVPAGNVLASETGKLDTGKAGAALARSESVDVVMRRLSDMLAAGLGKLPGAGRYQRLAVLPFVEVGPESKKRELGAVVTAELSTDLRQFHGLLLVERARLGAVLAEVKLGEMGLVDPKDAPKVGKILDAQALVVGSVADAGDRFLVNARIVTTETAETLATASEAVSAGSLIAFSAESVVLRSRTDAMYRSLLLPGWGQVYNRQPIKAWIFGGAAVLTVGAAVAFQLQGSKAQRDYDTLVTSGQLGSDPAAKAAALRADAEQAYQRRNACLWGAAGVWVVAAADAYLFGVDGEKAASGLALAPLPSEVGTGVALAWRF